MVTNNITKAHTRYIANDGVQVPGATTVLGILSKPALILWANRLGLQGIDSNKYKDKMADIGTLAHLMILKHLSGLKTDTSEYSQNDIEQAENCFLSYLEWEKSHKLEPILIEKPLVSDFYGYGGTPDFFGYVDGEQELIDFKTGKALYSESFYQVAAYAHLIKEQGHEIKRARILRIGRDNDEGFEERTIINMSQEFELFLHCLAIYNLKKEMKHR